MITRTILAFTLAVAFLLGGVATASAADFLVPTNECAAKLRDLSKETRGITDGNTPVEKKQALAKGQADQLFEAGCVSDPVPIYTPMAQLPNSEVQGAVDAAAAFIGPLVKKPIKLNKAIKKAGFKAEKYWQLKSRWQEAPRSKAYKKFKRLERFWTKRSRTLWKKSQAFGRSLTAFKYELTRIELHSIRALSPFKMDEHSAGMKYELKFFSALLAINTRPYPILPSYDLSEYW